MTTAAVNSNAMSSRTTDVYTGSPHSKTVMRQTQGLIGTVLLAGAAASYFVSMSWIVVPLIIGTGLLFAGATGVCPMASLIARMPWNKAAEADLQGSSGSCCGGRC